MKFSSITLRCSLVFFLFVASILNTFAQQGSGMGNAIDITGMFANNIFTDVKNNNPASGFGNNYNSGNLGGQPSDDIWYKFTINQPASIWISLCNTMGVDTYLHLLNNTGERLHYNDDDGPMCGGLASSIETTLSAGQYYVVVEGYGDHYGNIHTTINLPQWALGSISSINSISKWKPRTEINNQAMLKAYENSNYHINIENSYINGLGHTVQIVGKALSPTGLDIVSLNEFDNLSRKTKNYLPYTVTSSGPGNYRDLAITEQTDFYGNSNNSVARTAYPTWSTLIEDNAIQRVLEQGSSGDFGQLSNSGVANSGRTTKYEYTDNNTTPITDVYNSRLVYNYGVLTSSDGTTTLVLNSGQYYAAGDLFVKVIKDANWTSSDGKAGTKELFTDKNEQVLLERSFIKNAANQLQILSTYYVFDDFGNQAFVLPPAVQPDQPNLSGPPISTDQLTKFCYQYQYDERERVIAKKIPGKQWQYFVYNSLNQVVAVQDGNGRMKNEWAIKKYDGFSRLIISGVWNNNNTAIERADLQNLIDNQTNLWEERISTSIGYTSQAWPQLVNKFYVINYYDDYDVPGLPIGYGYQAITSNSDKSDATKGAPTVAKIWSLSNPSLELWTVNYFDTRGNIIQAHQTNHLSGKDVINNEYNFTGLVVKTERRHVTSSQDLLISKRYVYDHNGRILQEHEKIGNDNEILLAQFEYNSLGQLIDKKLHLKQGNSKFLQSIDYRYGLDGQLVSINDPELVAINSSNEDYAGTSDEDKFGMSIHYKDAALPQYNGNIGGIKWKVKSPAPSSNAYDFRFDGLNRLTEAVFSSGFAKNKNFDEYLDYDEMGNIKTLGRWANLSSGRQQIDSLTYSYNGNQLDRLDDNTGNNTYGFGENPNGTVIRQAEEYTYDANGNLTKDLNKGITLITYNAFDLPETINFSNGNSLTFQYNSIGKRLNRIFTTGGGSVTTDYLTDILYEQGSLSLLHTSQGLARRNGNGTYTYQYTLTDHLGNTRVMIQPNYADETLADLVQISTYYPYGLEFGTDISNSYLSFVSGDKNDFLFNGKEMQEEVAMYDFGARMYDPSIGRWNGVDPADQFTNASSYLAFGNNPVAHIDPDGRFVHIIVGAVLGAVINVAVHVAQGKTSFRDIAMAAVIGGTAGAVGAATGGASLAASGFTATSFFGGAIAGASGSVMSTMIQSVGNAAYFGDPLSNKEIVQSAIMGGLTGGLAGGITGKLTGGGNFWTGAKPTITIGRIMTDAQVKAFQEIEAKGGRYAFGLKNEVVDFADEIGASHLMKDPNWKSTFTNVINNSKNELHFTLNGIDETPMQMILNPGRSGINWEMHTLYNSPAFERTIFQHGGNTYKGFDVFKIKL